MEGRTGGKKWHCRHSKGPRAWSDLTHRNRHIQTHSQDKSMTHCHCSLRADPDLAFSNLNLSTLFLLLHDNIRVDHSRHCLCHLWWFLMPDAITSCAHEGALKLDVHFVQPWMYFWPTVQPEIMITIQGTWQNCDLLRDSCILRSIIILSLPEALMLQHFASSSPGLSTLIISTVWGSSMAGSLLRPGQAWQQRINHMLLVHTLLYSCLLDVVTCAKNVSVDWSLHSGIKIITICCSDQWVWEAVRTAVFLPWWVGEEITHRHRHDELSYVRPVILRNTLCIVVLIQLMLKNISVLWNIG